MKIYTKTGDRGTSSLFNGERVSKADIHYSLLGDVDELSANIGLCIDFGRETGDALIKEDIIERASLVQGWLIDVGALIATPAQSSTGKIKRLPTDKVKGYVSTIEEWIDDTDSQLPQLTTFIHPTGNLTCSQMHIARAVCRRVERCLINFMEQKGCESLLEKDDIMTFFNRLSDWMFVAARYCDLVIEK
jgi:cob(I)alamin adenosyltransferase